MEPILSQLVGIVTLKSSLGPREMAQPSRVHNAVTEDLSSIPST